MKKILVSICLLVFGLCFVGCEQVGVNIKFDNTSSINKIEITEYDVNEGYIVNSITLEDAIQINYICDNFTSLKLRKITDTNKPTSIKYNFVFFNDDNEVEIIGITAHNWIDYRGCFHSIQQGEIDFNFINNLSKKSYKLAIQNETDYELIGIKNEYKAGEEVEVKMIYEDAVVTYVHLNGKNIGWLNGINSVTFNMPAKDSVLVITYCEEIYKVDVIDNFDLLIIPLKQYYTSGETIQVITKFLSGPRVDVQVDGQFLEVKELDAFGYYGYEFIMSEKDVEIVILYNGLINYPCENNEHQWDEGVEIDTGTGTPVVEYTCKLCGNKHRETLTVPVFPSECPYEWIKNEECHSINMLCDCHEALAVDEPHEDLDSNQICDICEYVFDTSGINGYYQPELVTYKINDINLVKEVLEHFSLWIQKDTLFLDSCIFANRKIGELCPSETKLFSTLNLDKFYYENAEDKDLVKALFSQESYYSTTLESYPESAQQHYLTELNGDLYYIYICTSIFSPGTRNDIYVFKLNK